MKLRFAAALLLLPLAAPADDAALIARIKEKLKDTVGWSSRLPPLRDIAQMVRAEHPEWVWPAGRTHIVASPLDAQDFFKVFVEPGGSFSPGVRTFGVTPWILEDGKLHCAERLPDNGQEWKLEQGYLPIVTSRARLGGAEVETALVATGDLDRKQAAVFYRVTVRPATSRGFRGQFALAVRWIGPAGGLIPRLRAGKDDLVIAATAPESVKVASLDRDGADISVMLERVAARTFSGEEMSETGILSYALLYSLELRAGQERSFDFICPIQRMSLPPELRGFDDARRREIAAWEKTFGHIRVETPDARIGESLRAIFTHQRWWLVHGYWRHSPVTYPLFWLRDAAMMNDVFNKFRIDSLTRPNADYIARNLFMSGFGAEADAPGQGLWCLEQHYRFTRDRQWLAAAWPWVSEKAEMLIRMMTATEAVRVLREPVLPFTLFDPEMDLVADAAREGLIIGRMDQHRPLVWVNSWAVAGLRGAALLARESGRAVEAGRYQEHATRLSDALSRYAGKELGRNERDFAGVSWPTRAFASADSRLQKAFETRWQHHVKATGRYQLRSEWPYFDAAEAHNRLWMGEREKALEILDHFLSNQHAPGMYLWREGPADHADRFTTWSRIAGWLDHPTIIPHGWVAAEVALLVRDLFVFEEGDALVFAAGVPDDWLKPGRRVAISGFDTWWGRVAMTALSGERLTEVRLELPDGAPPFEVRLPGNQVADGARSTGRRSWLAYPIWQPAGRAVTIRIPRDQ